MATKKPAVPTTVFLLCANIEGSQAYMVLNAIEWNASAPYQPPPGQFIVVKSGDEWIGWTYENGQWTAPEVPPPEQEEPADDGAQ